VTAVRATVVGWRPVESPVMIADDVVRANAPVREKEGRQLPSSPFASHVDAHHRRPRVARPCRFPGLLDGGPLLQHRSSYEPPEIRKLSRQMWVADPTWDRTGSRKGERKLHTARSTSGTRLPENVLSVTNGIRRWP
jgi:hypothetical protein